MMIFQRVGKRAKVKTFNSGLQHMLSEEHISAFGKGRPLCVRIKRGHLSSVRSPARQFIIQDAVANDPKGVGRSRLAGDPDSTV